MKRQCYQCGRPLPEEMIIPAHPSSTELPICYDCNVELQEAEEAISEEEVREKLPDWCTRSGRTIKEFDMAIEASDSDRQRSQIILSAKSRDGRMCLKFLQELGLKARHSKSRVVLNLHILDRVTDALRGKSWNNKAVKFFFGSDRENFHGGMYRKFYFPPSRQKSWVSIDARSPDGKLCAKYFPKLKIPVKYSKANPSKIVLKTRILNEFLDRVNEQENFIRDFKIRRSFLLLMLRLKIKSLEPTDDFRPSKSTSPFL